jgi:hypothetical protein
MWLVVRVTGSRIKASNTPTKMKRRGKHIALIVGIGVLLICISRIHIFTISNYGVGARTNSLLVRLSHDGHSVWIGVVWDPDATYVRQLTHREDYLYADETRQVYRMTAPFNLRCEQPISPEYAKVRIVELECSILAPRLLHFLAF